MVEIAHTLIAAPPWVWAVALGVLGAILGSFIAAMVIRWPLGRSLLVGRSHCDACNAVLGPVDLVPLVSALAMRGRCRHCAAPIDPLHWRIELAALGVGVAAGALVAGPMAVAAAVFGWLLLALAALDITDFWLPDALTLTLALAGLATGWLGIAPPLLDRMIGGAAGFGALWAVGAAYKAYRGHDGLGGGDPKLLGAIGLWLGWRMLPVVVVVASMAGLGVALFWLATGRGVARDDQLPFGALLAVAAYPAAIAMLILPS
ncbi:A24 family peptidase [Sphingomonas sp. 28-63-12]|uniref:prepilin peptidase n=1 Tax=Sphingomonas sp. 28-63-12 TaxID=1970434 RepID=UPI000BCDB459|nr:MAG: prepilin peptidase [Sphingomonas sp. 28-63-12]